MVRTFAARLGVWRLAIFLVSALWLACPARPAQISVSSHGGPSLITLSGEFDFSDVIKFLRKTEGLQDAVVVLKGPGGNAVAGMQIGKAIRQKGFLTVVPSFTNCASACALAWLGGLPRFMAQDSRIGFHTAYFIKGERPRISTAANSLVAAYLKELQLPRQAIAYFTGASPEHLFWLTIAAAHSLGIEAGIYTSQGITSTLGKAPPVAATPMKQPPSGMTIKEATDYPGNDVDRLQQTTLADCVLACSDSADCKAVTFITSRRECWIKSAIGSAEPRDGLISATK